MARKEAMPRRPRCWMCGERRRKIRVMRRIGEGDQAYDDPDYAIQFCDRCDVAE
jgi:hypothetical protein